MQESDLDDGFAPARDGHLVHLPIHVQVDDPVCAYAQTYMRDCDRESVRNVGSRIILHTHVHMHGEEWLCCGRARKPPWGETTKEEQQALTARMHTPHTRARSNSPPVDVGMNFTSLGGSFPVCCPPGEEGIPPPERLKINWMEVRGGG